MKPSYLELVEALGKAIETYQYASMTAWEREATATQREEAERVHKLATADYAETITDAREACFAGGVLEREPRN